VSDLGFDASTEWTARLLWESCRRDLDIGRIKEALANGADGSQAALLSVPHKLGPLLWRALSRSGDTAALGEYEQVMGELAEVRRVQAMLLFPRAVAVAVEPLIESGFEPLILKGPTIAARYPEPGLRPMIDLDLLLPRRQHSDAVSALAKSGWQVVRGSALDRYDSVLIHDDVPSLSLELHYGLEAWYERYTAISAQWLWDARIPIDCLGTPAYGLPLEEELVMLSAHAGKPFHTFAQLLWIADLAMVCTDPSLKEHIDWPRVRRAAQDARCVTVTAVALELARLVGVESPLELLELPTKGWRGNALRELLEPTWPVLSGGLPTFHLRYALSDSLARRLGLLCGAFHDMPWRRRLLWPMTAAGQAARRWDRLRSE
jgi:hypothetical protein